MPLRPPSAAFLVTGNMARLAEQVVGGAPGTVMGPLAEAARLELVRRDREPGVYI